LEITEILLQNGASITRSENYRYSPLHEAVLKDQEDICKLLLKYGSDVNERTENNATPTMLVCGTEGLKNRRHMLEILLSSGADVNAFSDRVSYTHPYQPPLTEYLKLQEENTDFEIISILVQNGARVSFRGTRGVLHIRDPYGVLSLLKKFSPAENIFSLLVEASFYFDVGSIEQSDWIASDTKQYLVRLGSSPRELKHLIRLSLHKFLAVRVPSKVEKLPLPPLLKSYLKFNL
jgi:hypothetical protein